MWFFLYIYIVVTTLAFLPLPLPDSFWVIKEISYFSLGLVLIGISFFDKSYPKNNFNNLWFLLAFVYLAISFIIFFYIPIVFPRPDGGIVYNIWNIRPTINLILALLIIKLLIDKTLNLKVWVNIASFLCWMAFLCSIYMLFQYCGLDPIFNREGVKWSYVNGVFDRRIHMVGFFNNKFLSTGYLAILAPLCLMFKGLRYKIFYAVIAGTILLSGNALSLAAIFLALLLYLILNKNYRMVFVSIIIMAIGFTYLQHGDKEFGMLTGRDAVWRDTISYISSKGNFLNGIFGFGLGSFSGKIKFPPNLDGNTVVALSAHNEYLQVLFECGFYGLIVFMGYLIFLWIRSISNIIKSNSILMIGYLCSLLSLMIIAFGGFPFRIASLGLLTILIIASLEAQNQEALNV